MMMMMMMMTMLVTTALRRPSRARSAYSQTPTPPFGHHRPRTPPHSSLDAITRGETAWRTIANLGDGSTSHRRHSI
jgi:hypothetical protein